MRVHRTSGSCPSERAEGYRPRSLSGLSVLAAVGFLWLLFGCSRSPEAIPPSPPDAVEVMVERLADNQPQVLWDALPPSYQADIRQLIQIFCARMDSNLYDRAFGVLSQSVRVLKEQEEFIFNSPIALSVPMLESSMGSQWDDAVGLLDSIAKSDLSTLDSLSRLNPGDFLASTGHRVMDRWEALRSRAQRTAGPNPWKRLSQSLKDAQVEFLVTREAEGVLRFNSTTNAAMREVELTQVEGRWVPTRMAVVWEGRIKEAKTNLEKLQGPEFEKAKPMISMVLGTLESALDSLLKARNQEEFDATLENLAAVGGMLQAMRANR